MENFIQNFDKYTWSSYSSMIRRTQIDGKCGYLGMEVEPTWLMSFQDFVDEVGIRPEGMTLDRIDVYKGYIKGNCRWASWSTQARNKTNTLYVEYKGEEHVLIDLCEDLGADYEIVRGRLKLGFDLEKAIEQPKRHSWAKFEVGDKTFTLREYCEFRGMNYQLIRDRLRFGWDLEEAMTTPKSKKRKTKLCEGG